MKCAAYNGTCQQDYDWSDVAEGDTPEWVDWINYNHCEWEGSEHFLGTRWNCSENLNCDTTCDGCNCAYLKSATLVGAEPGTKACW